MPYIDVQTSAEASPKVRDALLLDLVRVTAKHLGKPEEVTMASVTLGAAIAFKGSTAPAAYVSVRAIGLPDVPTRSALVGGVSTLLEEVLGVPNDRIFVVLEDVPREAWGVRGTILA